MDLLLRSWLERIDARQDAHDLSDKKTFAEIFMRLIDVEKKMAKLLVFVAIINAVGGALLTIGGMIIAKKLGF